MRSSLTVVGALVLAFGLAPVDAAHAQEDSDAPAKPEKSGAKPDAPEKSLGPDKPGDKPGSDADSKPAPVTERLFELAQKLLDDRSTGSNAKERRRLFKALDAILEETTFGEGDTAKARTSGKAIKTDLRARPLALIAEENPHPTSIDNSCVLGETVQATSLRRSVVIAREDVHTAVCEGCVVICLGDFECTSGDQTVVIARGHVTTNRFSNSVIWAEDKVAGNPGLDADFAELAGKLDGSSRARIEDVKALMAKFDPNAVGDALRRIRKYRWKAAVPVLLEYMLRARDNRMFTQCARTLTLLLGERAPEPSDPSDAARRLATRKWVEETWTPNRSSYTTDLMQLDRSKLEVVVSELKQMLLEAAQLTRDELDEGSSAQTVQHVLTRLVDRDALKLGDAVLTEEVVPSMASALLERAGDESDAWASARLLSLLVIKGETEEIDKTANDASRPVFSRLAALLAGWIGGNDLTTASVEKVQQKAKRLDERIAVALVLGRTRDVALEASFLELLKDRSAEIRAAALYGMGELRLKTMPAEVKDLVVKKGEEWPEFPSLLFAVSSFRGDKEAMALVATTLQQAVAASTDRSPQPSVGPRLAALERVSGQRWTHDDDYRRPSFPGRPAYVDLRAAKAALEWWKTQSPAKTPAKDPEPDADK